MTFILKYKIRYEFHISFLLSFHNIFAQIYNFCLLQIATKELDQYYFIHSEIFDFPLYLYHRTIGKYFP
jgi:hypothetical protein